MQSTNSFPIEGLQPKRETQVEEFLAKNPSYNGKGVIIAILDSGIDSAAQGLSKCPDGSDKILDVVDCTGSGDVVLGEEILISPSQTSIKGLSGKELKLGNDWRNPSGKFRLGLIKLYDFFPSELVKRISGERKEKFLKQHSILLSKEQSKFDEWTSKHPNVKTAQELIERQEFESRISALKLLQEEYESYGEVVDVVTFHDGTNFRAAFDLTTAQENSQELGDLSQATLFTDYRHEHQYGTFSQQDMLTFSVNFYSEGRILSVVTNACSHGTHVAAITSAYFPENQEKNGIAPGAQIISLKIGDTRLGSLETGIGLARAVKCIKEWKCHLVNMSYGEAIAYSNYGFFIQEMQELVWNHGVIFVSSAGNNGPCISTVGAPGGTSSCCIGVGAYVTQSMMKAEYSLREKNPDMPYSWSSNGPTFDGDSGVVVYAPGAAITSVPRCTLSPNQRMNGTSMSSPNACGCLALVLSGCIQQQVPFSFPRVKNALLCSSQPLKERVSDCYLGAGLIQVFKLFENLLQNQHIPFFDFFFGISVPELDNARGIYIRRSGKANELRKEYFTVDVSVGFPRELDNNIKIQYESYLSLCATQSWISVPDNLHLNSNGNKFQVCINYDMIDEGSKGNVYYGMIKAFDSRMSGNNVFCIPVTIVRPIELASSERSISRQVTVKNGQMERIFVVPPSVSASAATISIAISADENASLDAKPMIVYLDALQINKHKKASHLLTKANAFSMLPNDAKKIPIEIPSGEPIEFCFGLFWSSHGVVQMEFKLEFCGAVAQSGFERLIINSDCSFGELSLNALDSGKQKPNFQIHSLVKTLLPPNKSPINAKAMDERSFYPHSGCQLYELILDYSFKLAEDSEVEFSSKSTDSFLYDSALTSFLLQVFQRNGKRVFFTSESSSRRTKGLKAGSYNVSLQLVHANKEKLEEWRTFALSLHIFSLAKLKECTLEFYPNIHSIGEKSCKLDSLTLKKNQICKFFVTVSHKELNSCEEVGDSILFSLWFGNEAGKRIFIQRILPKLVDKKDEISLEKEPESSLLLDGMISLYKSLEKDLNKQTFDLIEASFSKEPKWMLIKLQKAKDNQEICSIADEIIDSMNFQEVISYDSSKYANNPIEKAIHARESAKFSTLKDILIEALYRKCLAHHETQDKESFQNAFSRLQQAVPAIQDKRNLALAYIRSEMLVERYGNALVACVKALKEAEPAENSFAASSEILSNCRCELLQLLHWNCWHAQAKKAHMLNHSPEMKRKNF